MKPALIKNSNCPRPIRFDDDGEALLRHLKKLTGLSISNLIRRSVHYAAPRFLDGRINLLTLQDGNLAENAQGLENKSNKKLK